MRKDKDNIPCCKQFPSCLLSFCYSAPLLRLV